jgi:hypothetical protein
MFGRDGQGSNMATNLATHVLAYPRVQTIDVSHLDG